MEEQVIIKRILKIIENTANELLQIINELKSINYENHESYSVKISEKAKTHGRKNN